MATTSADFQTPPSLAGTRRRRVKSRARARDSSGPLEDVGEALADMFDQRQPRGSMVMQSVIVSKEVAKTAAQARKIAAQHAPNTSKVDETSTSFRFRQADPSKMDPESYRTTTVAKGVSVVWARPRGK